MSTTNDAPTSLVPSAVTKGKKSKDGSLTNGKKPADVNQVDSAPAIPGLDPQTARIQQKLRLIQADDVAQMGKARRVKGLTGNLIYAGYEHSQLTWSNLKRYIYYVTETWSLYIMK